jgi:hypothetical protein
MRPQANHVEEGGRRNTAYARYERKRKGCYRKR